MLAMIQNEKYVAAAFLIQKGARFGAPLGGEAKREADREDLQLRRLEAWSCNPAMSNRPIHPAS